MQDFGIYLSIGTLAGLIVYAVKATWKIRDLETGIRADMDAQVENVSRDVSRIERDTLTRADALRHEIGETFQAIRTKIHETETWNRDTFVRKDSFEMVVGRLEKSIDKLGDRFEEKLDKAVERIERRDLK